VTTRLLTLGILYPLRINGCLGETDNPGTRQVAHGGEIQMQESPISVARAPVCQQLEASHQCPKPKRRL
jgi:hypothetical protein